MCGQDFTRRYNANRHNRNLHSNRAEIVRFLKYLIGRISAKYLPGDPLSYKIKNRSKNKSSFVHENNTNNFKQKESSLHYNENLRHIVQPNKENRTYNTNNTDLNFKDSVKIVQRQYQMLLMV